MKNSEPGMLDGVECGEQQSGVDPTVVMVDCEVKDLRLVSTGMLLL